MTYALYEPLSTKFPMGAPMEMAYQSWSAAGIFIAEAVRKNHL